MSHESPLEQFKQVLTGTARALAHEPEVELAFTADAPSQAGKNFKVPMPGRLLPPDQVAEARGFADSFALKLKHHDAARHAALRPSEVIAGAAFDAVENARVEALGSRNMAGIAANLGHALERDTANVVKAAGGEIKGQVRAPLNSSDFSSFLLQCYLSSQFGYMEYLVNINYHF